MNTCGYCGSAFDSNTFHSCGPSAPAADPVEHHPVDNATHLTSHPSGIEFIEVAEEMSFNAGSALKYLWRYELKDAPVEDLQKAIWYTKREILRLERRGSSGSRDGSGKSETDGPREAGE